MRKIIIVLINVLSIFLCIIIMGLIGAFWGTSLVSAIVTLVLITLTLYLRTKLVEKIEEKTPSQPKWRSHGNEADNDPTRIMYMGGGFDCNNDSNND